LVPVAEIVPVLIRLVIVLLNPVQIPRALVPVEEIMPVLVRFVIELLLVIATPKTLSVTPGSMVKVSVQEFIVIAVEEFELSSNGLIGLHAAAL